jgi:hypothetical protein
LWGGGCSGRGCEVGVPAWLGAAVERNELWTGATEFGRYEQQVWLALCIEGERYGVLGGSMADQGGAAPTGRAQPQPIDRRSALAEYGDKRGSQQQAQRQQGEAAHNGA